MADHKSRNETLGNGYPIIDGCHTRRGEQPDTSAGLRPTSAASGWPYLRNLDSRAG